MQLLSIYRKFEDTLKTHIGEKHTGCHLIQPRIIISIANATSVPLQPLLKTHSKTPSLEKPNKKIQVIVPSNLVGFPNPLYNPTPSPFHTKCSTGYKVY